MDNSTHSLAADLRARDYDRFLAIQLARPERRAGLYVLALAHAELGHIAHAVTEPLMGHMRLAWWREGVEEIMSGRTPRPHPVLQALANNIAYDSAIFPLLLETIEARAADLDPDSLVTLEDWRRYDAQTAGNLHLAMALMLDEAAAQAHKAAIIDAGAAYATLSHIRGLARGEACSEAWRRAHGDSAEQLRVMVDAALHAVPLAPLPKTLLPLSALARLTRFHASRIRRAGYEPTRLRPARLGAVWAVLMCQCRGH